MLAAVDLVSLLCKIKLLIVIWLLTFNIWVYRVIDVNFYLIKTINKKLKYLRIIVAIGKSNVLIPLAPVQHYAGVQGNCSFVIMLNYYNSLGASQYGAIKAVG